MKRRDRRGFTLAELLIVVAIIAILIAIAIPVFTKQLEKSRDATTAANLRAAFAEASDAYITLEKSGNVTDISTSGGEYLVTVQNVTMRSSDDSLGDVEDSLPFEVRPGVVEGSTTKTVVFHFFTDDTEPYVTADGAGGGESGGAEETEEPGLLDDAGNPVPDGTKPTYKIDGGTTIDLNTKLSGLPADAKVTFSFAPGSMGPVNISNVSEGVYKADATSFEGTPFGYADILIVIKDGDGNTIKEFTVRIEIN